ncbi:hypothetical protein PoB_006481400 [Plakobranchus ocellatus]|uniref:Uncharacterized protein n=1 Tax=Plakobranchus ocellatus TaxID=259542 RepID=A0AAV4D2B4_9GAST|nr:hypothetical protein PoB_006481400 [Plakobranchus ocellatus]
MAAVSSALSPSLRLSTQRPSGPALDRVNKAHVPATAGKQENPGGPKILRHPTFLQIERGKKNRGGNEACLQQGDLRFQTSFRPKRQYRTRICDRRVPADLSADSLTTMPLTPALSYRTLASFNSLQNMLRYSTQRIEIIDLLRTPE